MKITQRKIVIVAAVATFGLPFTAGSVRTSVAQDATLSESPVEATNTSPNIESSRSESPTSETSSPEPPSSETSRSEAPNPESVASNAPKQTSQQAHADDDSPALGVMVGSCPGEGVCVLDIVQGSPATRAGIEPGDYILAINDQSVSTPRDLKQRISELNTSDQVAVSVWRQGQTMVKQVTLASEAKELPGSHRGWLGVQLSAGTDGDKGVHIQDVHPRSPAKRAGLRAGDVITKLNGEAIESIDSFVTQVQDFEPGEKLDLSVRRNDDEQTIDVTLGQVSDAPLQWFRQSFRMPIDDSTFPLPLSPEAGLMDEVIDDMRAQIRSLQKQVDELKRPTAPPVDSSLEGAEEAPAPESNQEDLSTLEDVASQRMFLAQYDGTRELPPNISNDWTRSRYNNRNYQNRDRDRDRNRGDYRYRSGYRSYSPYLNRGYRNNPYRYYNYGGRPYYYGGGYPYGFRGGIQVRPNYGVWW